MGLSTMFAGSMVIPLSGTTGTTFSITSLASSKAFFSSTRAFTIYVPATLTGTVTLQASWLETPTTNDWRTVTATMTAGTAVTVIDLGFKALRVSSGSAEAAERVFPIVASIETTS